jgi:hypothetical protein
MRGENGMRRLWSGVAAASVLLLGACGSDGGATEASTKLTVKEGVDADSFSDSSVRIDNRWFPLKPGTQFVYEGRANRGGGILPHRVVFTVTDLTKEIGGVNTVVLLDQDINEGKTAEQEITFHAQDDEGNVWNFGEYPEEFENGEFIGAESTWLAGTRRSLAGIIMPADPRPNGGTYLQGFAPSVEFRDEARVTSTTERACVREKCYENLLLVEETAPLEPADGYQLKYYARGVGNVLVEPRGGVEQEVLELVEVRRLSAKDLAAARALALKLDKRAYEVEDSAAVWRGTEPAKRAPTTDESA